MNNHNKSIIKVLGIDLAKTSFQLHGVNHEGITVLRKNLSRKKVAPYLVKIKPCLIGMEACAGAHYWVRVLIKMPVYETHVPQAHVMS